MEPETAARANASIGAATQAATQAARLANFVIGGTEKAGTTSVFDYLSAHPQVCASSRKETDFFRNEYSGEREVDARRYAAYFERCNPAIHIGNGDGIIPPAKLTAHDQPVGEAPSFLPRGAWSAHGSPEA